MQAMIERLMEENAQLRAEKMLLAATTTVESSTSSILLINSKTEDQINLYSTVRNKKFNNFEENFAFITIKQVLKHQMVIRSQLTTTSSICQYNS